jgi:hypothetical protein
MKSCPVFRSRFLIVLDCDRPEVVKDNTSSEPGCLPVKINELFPNKTRSSEVSNYGT